MLHGWKWQITSLTVLLQVLHGKLHVGVHGTEAHLSVVIGRLFDPLWPVGIKQTPGDGSVSPYKLLMEFANAVGKEALLMKFLGASNPVPLDITRVGSRR
jgi:hypothetical protein